MRKSISQLPKTIRPIAANAVATARQLRNFETQHGAIQKHNIESFACFLVNLSWKMHLKRQQQEQSDSKRQQEQSVGLEPPPQVMVPNDDTDEINDKRDHPHRRLPYGDLYD